MSDVKSDEAQRLLVPDKKQSSQLRRYEEKVAKVEFSDTNDGSVVNKIYGV